MKRLIADINNQNDQNDQNDQNNKTDLNDLNRFLNGLNNVTNLYAFCDSINIYIHNHSQILKNNNINDIKSFIKFYNLIPLLTKYILDDSFTLTNDPLIQQYHGQQVSKEVKDAIYEHYTAPDNITNIDKLVDYHNVNPDIQLPFSQDEKTFFASYIFDCYFGTDHPLIYACDIIDLINESSEKDKIYNKLIGFIKDRLITACLRSMLVIDPRFLYPRFLCFENITNKVIEYYKLNRNIVLNMLNNNIYAWCIRYRCDEPSTIPTNLQQEATKILKDNNNNLEQTLNTDSENKNKLAVMLSESCYPNIDILLTKNEIKKVFLTNMKPIVNKFIRAVYINNLCHYSDIVKQYFEIHSEDNWDDYDDWIFTELNEAAYDSSEIEKIAAVITLDIMETNEIDNVIIDNDTDLQSLIFNAVVRQCENVDIYENDDDEYDDDDDDDDNW